MIKLKKLIKEFNKAHFLNLIKQQIESLKGQIAYSKDKIRDKNLEQWERKEYQAVLKDNIKDLKAIEKHYKRVQKLKEEKLNEVIQPKVGDFFEWDSWLKLGKIIKIDSKQIYVKPLKGTFGKAVDSVQFDIKKLKFRTSKDKPIWKPK